MSRFNVGGRVTLAAERDYIEA
ncbi:hypothetical protein LCGC14_2616240, partial [marine sediment metagenome]